MTAIKSKLILALALLYIASQAILISLYGIKLEIILLSFGVALALGVIILFMGDVALGRPIVESVSMRRKKLDNELQERMKNDGYEIDKDFLEKKRFESSKDNLSGAVIFEEKLSNKKTPQEKLQSMISSQAPMFGGLEKMNTMLTEMDDDSIQKMIRRFGFKEFTAPMVREAIATLISNEKNPELQLLHSTKPKTSLDMVDFYDYIKRSMSGNDMESRGQAPVITGNELLNEVKKGEYDEMKTMKIMRGVRKGKGIKKCENCMHFESGSESCMKLFVQVEINDACDAWERPDWATFK